jgi:hypothetical protein
MGLGEMVSAELLGCCPHHSMGTLEAVVPYPTSPCTHVPLVFPDHSHPRTTRVPVPLASSRPRTTRVLASPYSSCPRTTRHPGL